MEAAIQSALNQTHRKIEVIVIDDGSTDDSWGRIELFRDRITALRQTNSGACKARNCGLTISNGKWIKFLDADDILKEDCIELQLKHCKDNSTIIFGDCEYMDSNGVAYPVVSSELGKRPSINDGEFATLSTFFAKPILISTTLYAKKILVKFGGFNVAVKRGQEHELNVRLYLNGVNFQYFSQVCFLYRQHISPTRISISRSKEHFFSYWENFKTLVAMAEFGSRAAIFDSNRLLLGRLAWKTGRHWLRQREAGIATQFFTEAQRISGSSSIYGSALYRQCVHVFGPNIAERISTFSFALRQGPKDGA